MVPHKNILLISCLCSFTLMLCSYKKSSKYHYLIVFSIIWLEIEPTIYRMHLRRAYVVCFNYNYEDNNNLLTITTEIKPCAPERLPSYFVRGFRMWNISTNIRTRSNITIHPLYRYGLLYEKGGYYTCRRKCFLIIRKSPFCWETGIS